jgi:hypothetical protein
MAPKKHVAAEPVKKSNKFRLVVFEGDFSDDSVSEIAQALTSALKPSAPLVMRQLQNGKPAGQLLPPEPEGDDEIEDEEQVIDAEVEETAGGETPAAPKTPRVTKPKVFKNPDFVELEWNGTGTPSVSLKDFAKQKDPKTKGRRYLVAALWLRDHAGHPSANIDQMYSCFRTAGWPVGFNDWRAPFDNLVYSKHMRKTGTGEFAITTLGEGLLQTPEA